MTPEQLVRWGHAEGMRQLLTDLAPAERVATVEPLTAAARRILAGRRGSWSKEWNGPLRRGHWRAASMVAHPTAEQVMADVPRVPEFIEHDVPELFPDDLTQIVKAWGELYLDDPEDEERTQAMLACRHWWDQGADVWLPSSDGVALLFLTGLQAPTLYAWLGCESGLAYRLTRLAFTVPGRKHACLEDHDRSSPGDRTVGGFLIPALISSGVLLQEEVLQWSDEALAMPERTEHDKKWFQRLKKRLTHNRVPVQPHSDRRWWLDPRHQLDQARLDLKAGLPRPDISGDPSVTRLLPLVDLLNVGTLTTSVWRFLSDERREDLAQIQQVLEEASLGREAALLAEAVALVEAERDPTLEVAQSQIRPEERREDLAQLMQQVRKHHALLARDAVLLKAGLARMGVLDEREPSRHGETLQLLDDAWVEVSWGVEAWLNEEISRTWSPA